MLLKRLKPETTQNLEHCDIETVPITPGTTLMKGAVHHTGGYQRKREQYMHF